MTVEKLSPEQQKKVLLVIATLKKKIGERFEEFPIWMVAQALTLLAVEYYVSIDAGREDFDDLVSRYWLAFEHHFAGDPEPTPSSGSVH